ncbi:hypothetical protein COU54_05645 [Candidatus Pacearchaeota archaeon CG10_big_fil_rev_8_21_14_0_10_31_24]|nr:MAG: hypothetical protein COU54_05645 [Candidatus Pacearchaeota archaeon CG10_big_fil_rev_8_21_14_0_10_31_24]
MTTHTKPLVVTMESGKDFILAPGTRILNGLSIRCSICNPRLPRGREQMVESTTGAPYTFRNQVNREMSPGSELFIPFTIPVTFQGGLRVTCAACSGPGSAPVEFVASSNPTFEGFNVTYNLLFNPINIVLFVLLAYLILKK